MQSTTGRSRRQGQDAASPAEGYMLSEHVPELSTMTLAELLDKRFDSPAWVIPNLLPVGLTILAAPPKTGKSLLALGLVLRVAYQVDGKRASGLYLSLDDSSERRLQARVLDILDGRPLEYGVWLTTSAATLDSGLLFQLAGWLKKHPGVRIVVVDALATIKAKRSSDDVFKSDYAGLKGFQELALECGVAVVLLHHTRKRPDQGDWVDRISGTLGIAATADALWLLERPRGSTRERLFVTSRDAPDTVLEVPLEDLLEGEWAAVGEDQAKATFLTDQALAVLVDAGPDGMSARALARVLRVPVAQAQHAVGELYHSHRIARLRYGQYTVCPPQVLEGASSPGTERAQDTPDDITACPPQVVEVLLDQTQSGLEPLSHNTCDTHTLQNAPSPGGERAGAIFETCGGQAVIQEANVFSPGGERVDAQSPNLRRPGSVVNGHDPAANTGDVGRVSSVSALAALFALEDSLETEQ